MNLYSDRSSQRILNKLGRLLSVTRSSSTLQWSYAVQSYYHFPTTLYYSILCKGKVETSRLLLLGYPNGYSSFLILLSSINDKVALSRAGRTVDISAQ
jgi:hypothetical protein